MDQLKEFASLVKRQHFWFLAPLVLVLAVLGWWRASNHLLEEYASNKQKVLSYSQELARIRSATDRHPNTEFHEGMQDLIDQRRQNVKQAWETKWERQKEQLQWPEDLPELNSYVEQMRPIESVDPQNRIPQTLRSAYGNYIKRELPELAASIGANWEPASRRGGFSSRGASEAVFRRPDSTELTDSSIVDWNPENQALIEDRFDWGTSVPSTLEVLYAQEDLWVLTTLIEIISQTNGDARTRSQAAVKAIDFIHIGSDVQPSTFQVLRPGPIGTDGGEQGDVIDREPMPEVSSSERMTGDEVQGQSLSPQERLIQNRYWDQDYQPIADLDTLLATSSVAKRIPVRMRLEVDQRYINRLLAACANAPLTFEVRQLRFNPSNAGLLGDDTSFRGEPTGDGRNIGNNRTKKLEDVQSLEKMIELFGIVYIFNPVDEARLNGQLPDAGVAEDDFAMN